MGLDGGTIITRSDILRGQSWDVADADGGASTSTRGGQLNDAFVHKRRRLDRTSQRAVDWSTCALSGEALREPVVCCVLGRLYNRERALEHVLTRNGTYTSEEATYAYANRLRTAASSFCHLRSRRDFFPVHLAGGRERGEGGFECPVFGVRCGAVAAGAFSAVRPCGHVMSDKAVKEAKALAAAVSSEADSVGAAGRHRACVCPVCEVPFDPAHCVPVYGTEEQVAALRAATEARHRAEDEAKAAKAAKKKMKTKPERIDA